MKAAIKQNRTKNPRILGGKSDLSFSLPHFPIFFTPSALCSNLRRLVYVGILHHLPFYHPTTVRILTLRDPTAMISSTDIFGRISAVERRQCSCMHVSLYMSSLWNSARQTNLQEHLRTGLRDLSETIATRPSVVGHILNLNRHRSLAHLMFNLSINFTPIRVMLRQIQIDTC